MGRTLSNASDIATELTNIPGELDSVLSFSPEAGRVLQLINNVERTEEVGIPVFMKLKDADGNDLPVDTEVALEFMSPDRERPLVASQVRRNIEDYRILSLTEQRKEEYIAGTLIKLRDHAETDETRTLGAGHLDEIRVSIRSPTEIDWSNSQISIYEAAVREGPA